MSTVMFFPGLVPSGYDAIRDFVTTDPHARRRFARADEILGYTLADAYREASIYDWEVYEAGYMALTLALADRAEEMYGRAPSLCGGQSFGSFMAAVRCGALSYEEALRLVRRSVVVETEWFDSLEKPLGCHFFYRLPHDTVDRLLAEVRARGEWAELSVILDEQVHAVSAELTTLARFEQRVREEGGFPFYTMNRAEHCSAVGGLRKRLHDEVYGGIEWHEATVPFLSDVDGRLLTDPEEIKQDLLDGWTTPVHWETVLRGMRTGGVQEVWIPAPRNMFARITDRSFPTKVITPRSALR
ncbi:ACP S-malonyltransferase [Streptomyces sp. XM83C]|jgi:[acyl-carrier-protein] S-malonyltransferase|uniref:[acyl-carrier-protein] S-malonyltransferase n=1 Tax=Streptomyces thermocoprophilus TaxID=78356 RepID=A0ABV5VIS2_9ACTN|nr:ACP S-malonyltransferase [Streptomyces sp. XM83C]MCK1820286.1 ACP S-malonyltransferase [Streptomyces sp. XM83C]